jgi:hypothetical protein
MQKVITVTVTSGSGRVRQTENKEDPNMELKSLNKNFKRV